MRISKVVLSDEEVVARERANARPTEAKADVDRRIDAILNERCKHREEAQKAYDRGIPGAIKRPPEKIAVLKPSGPPVRDGAFPVYRAPLQRDRPKRP